MIIIIIIVFINFNQCNLRKRIRVQLNFNFNFSTVYKFYINIMFKKVHKYTYTISYIRQYYIVHILGTF